MSVLQWMEWFLFGNEEPCSPPHELRSIILRMEAEKIPWSHIVHHGGFTALPYQILGDLNSLIDYLDREWSEPPPLKTRAVSRFWEEFQLLLARVKKPKPLPPPCNIDDEILKEMLDPQRELQFNYQSAEFWGEVAKRFIQLRRPEQPSCLPNASSDYLQRVMQLYDMTCQARGYYVDPFNMHLVPNSEYVNAVHWQSNQNLEAFLLDRPDHPLALSVQALLKRKMYELLDGKKPLVSQCPQLDAFLHNIGVIHASIEQVPHQNSPPKLIDIFQRLLALSHRDGLWEEKVPNIPVFHSGTSLLYLTEQIRIAEREKQILLRDSIRRDS